MPLPMDFFCGRSCHVVNVRALFATASRRMMSPAHLFTGYGVILNDLFVDGFAALQNAESSTGLSFN